MESIQTPCIPKVCHPLGKGEGEESASCTVGVWWQRPLIYLVLLAVCKSSDSETSEILSFAEEAAEGRVKDMSTLVRSTFDEGSCSISQEIGPSYDEGSLSISQEQMEASFDEDSHSVPQEEARSSFEEGSLLISHKESSFSEEST